MDVRHLQTLAAVAERGSFSGAAESLGVSQPAVSQQMRALEREVGEPLIDRGGRRARLTPRGEVVHRYALRMLALRDEYERELGETSSELAGRLVVGSSTGLGEHVLPTLLGGFRVRHPHVAVSLRSCFKISAFASGNRKVLRSFRSIQRKGGRCPCL